MTLDLATVTRDTFDALTGPGFTMHVSAEQRIALELFETSALPTAPNAKRPAFAVRFRSAERSHVPQRIYSVHHDQLGTLEIFLVPIGPDALGMVYEAVFS